MEVLVKAGGIYHLALVLFHLGFRRIFHWDEQLPRLGTLNRAVVPVLNNSLTFLFTLLAYLSFMQTEALLGTDLGRHLLGLIALFWLFRSLLQIVYYGLRHWLSWLFLGYFLAGAAIYSLPLLLR